MSRVLTIGGEGGVESAVARSLHPEAHAGAPALRELRQNLLLGSFPAPELLRCAEYLDRVRVIAGQVLPGAGTSSSHMFFPVDSIVSLVCLTEDGSPTEIAVVGNEGVVGIGLFMGGSADASRAVVQCAGLAYRIKASVLREEFNRSGEIRHCLLRYTQALLMQSAQMAVCNRHHAVEQQLCRWLLSVLDRSPLSELSMTQEWIANTLGVRRAGITEAASKLQKEGLLRCRRGRITVLDRPRLERRACECYGVMRHEFLRLFPQLAAAPRPFRPAPGGSAP